MADFKGVYTALLTPFTQDGSAIDWGVLRQSLDFQIENGIHGIIVAGSIGEFTTLAPDEWRGLVEQSISHVAGRVPLLIGTSAFTTAETIERCRFAQSAGADGVMVLPLGFWRLTDDEVLAHYSAISDAVDLPIMIYNNPPKTAGVDISAGLLARIEKQTRIRFVKETSYDVHRTQEIVIATAGKMTVFTGDDGAALPAFALGGRGWVAGMSNYIPAVCVAIFEEFEKGNLAGARNAHFKVVAIRSALEGTASYLGVTRAATRAIGIPVGPPRRPLLPLNGEDDAAVARVLRKEGII